GRVVGGKLPACRPGEEAGQDRLANVLAVEVPPQGRVGQPGADGDAEGGAVPADEVCGGGLVPTAEASEQVGEGGRVGHGGPVVRVPVQFGTARRGRQGTGLAGSVLI